MTESHYGRLVIMVGSSFVTMYVLMYAMVNTVSSVYLNVNPFCMV